MDKLELLDRLVILFFQHQIQIKMYHFQTSMFGSHKAVDTYLEKLNDNFDRFMEAAQGIYGRLSLKNVKISACMLSDDNIDQHLNEYVRILDLLGSIISEHSDLLAIRDEMMADANQLKYLLTFM